MKRNNVSKFTMVSVTLCGLLVMVCGWSFMQFRSARTNAQSASKSYSICQKLTQQMQLLEDGPKRAALEAQSASQLNGLIEQSAQKAKLPKSHIVRIDPQSARRIADSVYKQQPTHVELRLVSLKQLVSFLETLIGQESGLEVKSLRINAPRQDATMSEKTELWQAEVTLTNLLYEPKSSM